MYASQQASETTKQSSHTADGQKYAGAIFTSAHTMSNQSKGVEAGDSPKTLHALLDMPKHMELCQIELIYRAEGNANLVLALPQFKKVLRLPKMQTNDEAQRTSSVKPEKAQQQQQNASSSIAAISLSEKIGVLTMQDFMAYIEIIRRLLGNEFVCQTNIVAIPKASDRLWLNKHIRATRPIGRLDKEFRGQFGLLLPDATQLPSTFDVLLSNLQATTKGDTFAIEIKPKQGWLLLPSNVNDLFDLMPATTTKPATTRTAQPIQQTVQAKTAIRHTEAAKTEAISTTQSCTTSATSIPTETKEGKKNCRCRYCKMQFFKLRIGKINQVSAYCPLDIFSGIPARMFTALDALFACPQNNLRIFQNGNLIYGDHANSISWEALNANVFQSNFTVLIKHLLVTCLLREYDVVGNINTTAAVTPTVAVAIMKEPKVVAVETTTLTSTVAPAATPMSTMQSTQAGAVQTEANVVTERDVVKAVGGQPNHSSATPAEATNAAAVEVIASTQRRTPTSSSTTTAAVTTTTICSNRSSSASTKVKMVTETETKTETEALATQAQINKAEILCLPKNCVLQKILHLQLLAKHNFRHMCQSGYASRPEMSYTALRTLLAKRSIASVEQLTPAEQYMLGATAMDCSIMLTFQEIKFPQEQRSTIELHGVPYLLHLANYDKHYVSKVTLLDLDPKSDSHFYKYVKQTIDIENCYASKN